MDSKYKRWKGDWRVAFKCTFAEDEEGKRTWRYYQPGSEWSAINSKSLEDKDEGRIDIQKRIEFIIKKTNLKERLPNLQNAPFKNPGELFAWVPKQDKPTDIGDEGISTLLNHIVSSQSTKSLTMIASIVGNHRMVEMRGLRAGQAAWSYNRVELPLWKQALGNHLLGFPDLFFNRRNGDLKRWDEIGKILHAHRQKTEITVLKYEVMKDSCILSLRFDSIISHYERGARCNCIPIPGEPFPGWKLDPPEPIGVYSPEVVITSPVVEQALLDLSDIWQDKASAVLVSAPPGSGKEYFTLSIPYGSGRTGEKVPTISLADGTPEQQEKLILGYQQEDGSIVDGLIAKAKDFAIFIDEAHYPTNKPGMRAKLLRPLEAKEYYPVGSLELRKVDNVQWLFASSWPLDGGEKTLAKLEPNDFWTRMTHMLRIEHPLKMSNGQEPNDFWTRMTHMLRIKHPLKMSNGQERVLKHLFTFFWWDRVKSHFGLEPSKVLSTEKKCDDLYGEDVSEQLNRGYVYTMLKKRPLDTVAGAFARGMMSTVGQSALQEVSIRGLRSMISRIFSRCVGDVTAGIKDPGWGAIFNNDDTKKDINVPNDVHKYICKVISETQQIARLKS